MTDILLRGALMMCYVGLVFTSSTRWQRVVSVTAIAVSAVVEAVTR